MARNRDGLAILAQAMMRIPRGSPIRKRMHDVLDRDLEGAVHLGVFVEPFLGAIFDGRKTIESRFSVNRCAPFDRVQAGDVILLKRSGGPVVGVAVAGRALYYHLDTDQLETIREKFATRICADYDEFWAERSDKKFATLIEIEQVAKIETLDIEKRDRRGWVTYSTARPQCHALAD